MEPFPPRAIQGRSLDPTPEPLENDGEACRASKSTSTSRPACGIREALGKAHSASFAKVDEPVNTTHRDSSVW